MKIMNKIIISFVLSILIPPAFSACFDSLPLGHYELGGWSGPAVTDDATWWEVSGTVGTNDRYSTREDMAAARDSFINQCSITGNQMIKDAENHLIARKNSAGARFDASCSFGPTCSAIREITIKYQQDQIDDEISVMKEWFTQNISNCQLSFQGSYEHLGPRLCN